MLLTADLHSVVTVAEIHRLFEVCTNTVVYQRKIWTGKVLE